MTHFPNMLKQDLKVKGVDLSKASTNKCVCVCFGLQLRVSYC